MRKKGERLRETVESNADLRDALNKFYATKVTFENSKRTEALGIWKSVVESILDEVAAENPLFRFEEILYTGSSYEGVKTQSPDEFDLMLVMKDVKPVLKRRDKKLGKGESGKHCSPNFS